jgi:hypothetical protein
VNPSDSTALAQSDPRAKPLLPVGKAARTVLETFGVQGLCELVTQGHSHRAIGARLGVSASAVSCWLTNLRGPHAALYAESLRASAEAMLDEAEAVVRQSGPSTADVQRARCLADLLLRKAAIRNRAYDLRSAATVELVDAGSDQPPQVPQFVILIHPQHEASGRTFDHDSGDG